MNVRQQFKIPRRYLGNAARPNRCGALWLIVLICGLLLAGCASRPVPGRWTQAQSAALEEQLLQLGNGVNGEEAGRVAHAAVEQAAALAHEYRAVRPAWVGNYLVNYGWRERGLCYDWANGLYARLHNLGLRSFELHLAVARMDTSREHNSLVVTARGRPLAEGVVLDAWRHSGRLWFGTVATDKYPWQALPPERTPKELQKLVKQDAGSTEP